MSPSSQKFMEISSQEFARMYLIVIVMYSFIILMESAAKRKGFTLDEYVDAFMAMHKISTNLMRNVVSL